MVRSYLLSQLGVQALRLKAAGFLEKNPNAWLVRDTGSQLPTLDQPISTMAPRNEYDHTPRPGDALCFQLLMRDKNATSLKVGRATTNDIVVNDGTVSREHLVLTVKPTAGWSAQALANTTTTFMASPLLPGRTVHLFRGVTLMLGDVQLTYFDAEGMLDRLLNGPRPR